jgi:hypothetical protein
MVFQWDTKTLNESITSANYANACYGIGNGNSPLCDTYIVPQVCEFRINVMTLELLRPFGKALLVLSELLLCRRARRDSC